VGDYHNGPGAAAKRFPQGSRGHSGWADLPSCPGNEQKTPPEVLAYRTNGEANSPGWSALRTKQFPALRVEGEF
jgi:UDPglucose--hexose-1-phosphate uridylyltransferase